MTPNTATPSRHRVRLTISATLAATVVLALTAALSVVPRHAAGASSPGATVVVPANGTTVSGTKVVLDATASEGVTKVQFVLTGNGLNNSMIATASATEYGWLAEWNSTTVPDGSYTLESVATSTGTSSLSPGIAITVSNGSPYVTVLLPSSNTVAGSQVVLDATTSPGVTKVVFELAGGGPCYPTACDVGDGTLTPYGWAFVWNSQTVPNDAYILNAVAYYPNGAQGANGTHFTVDNTPTVVLPANDAILSGDQWLDCTSPPGTDDVQFWLSGGSLSAPELLGDGTDTLYGWLADWNTTGVYGSYNIYCTASYPGYGTEQSPSINVLVGAST